MKINVKHNYKEKKKNKNIYFIMSLFVFNFSNYYQNNNWKTQYDLYELKYTMNVGSSETPVYSSSISLKESGILSDIVDVTEDLSAYQYRLVLANYNFNYIDLNNL